MQTSSDLQTQTNSQTLKIQEENWDELVIQ